MAAAMMAGNAEAAASSAAKVGAQAWQAFKAKSLAAGKEGIRESAAKAKEINRGYKQLTFNVGKTAGRNSAGRITSFHRGGGAKRLYRKIDMKRSTTAMGVIERVEYDPNRSSRIALVRWVEGADRHFQSKCKAIENEFVPPQNSLEPITTAARTVFPLASLSRNVNQSKAASSPAGKTTTYAVVGLQTAVPGSKGLSTVKSGETKKSSVKDVFLSAFSTSRVKKETLPFALNHSLSLPRVAVAGAKPAFFASQVRENEEKSAFSFSEIQKWNSKSELWANRCKRKSAVPWQSFCSQNALGFTGTTSEANAC